MAEPRFWQSKAHPLALALLPVSLVYGLVERANRFFVKPQHPGKPVICVGNLTAGGAGKTPTVQYLAAHFAATKQVAILSRGYGGHLSTKSSPAIAVDPALHDAAAVGDEPLMLAADYPVFVNPDRFASLRAAIAQGAEIAIKDDGFQNPAMANHFNLIVVDGASGLGNGYLLPAGPLRQPLSVSLARTDAVLVQGAATHPSLAPLLAACAAREIAVYHGHISASAPPLETSSVFAFCGIAKPEKFFASLDTLGLTPVGQTVFGDHHPFTDSQAKEILAQAGAAPIVTTKKDMARLQNAAAGSYRRALAEKAKVVDITLEIEQAEGLLAQIEQTLTARQANQHYTSY